MSRHIRDFYVTSARKFKLNNDFSCSDNKKNGRNLPRESKFCAITSSLVKFRKSLHMAFEDDTSVENTRPLIKNKTQTAVINILNLHILIMT